jgi:hypothetical protein
MAKDRTVFLIAGATDTNVAGNGVASKARVAGKGVAVAKKAATKKVLGKKAPAKNAVVAAAPEIVAAQATA